MKKTLALGMAAAMTATLLAGCGGLGLEPEALDLLLENAALGRIVIDDEYALGHGRSLHKLTLGYCSHPPDKGSAGAMPGPRNSIPLQPARHG